MSRLTLKLWIGMMILILITLIFLWAVQTVFLQPYYNSQIFNEIKTKFEEIYKDAKNMDEIQQAIVTSPESSYLTDDENNYIYITDRRELTYKAMFGMKLVNTSVINIILDRIELGLKGESSIKIFDISDSVKAIFVFSPVAFPDGTRCVVVIKQGISNITSVQQVLKSQLNRLSIVLIIASFILSLFLAQIFTKPILAINKTVNRLAEGDLEASANVNQKDELGELSHSVDNLAKSLKKVDLLRKELIANVSHELKSPLSLIRGYAELVREISWKNEKDRNDNLNLIIDESQRMSIMVNDILDYSLIQSGYLTLKTDILPLDYIINDAVAEASLQGEKFNLNVEVNNQTPDVNVCVDNIKIHQVFRNLLNNAINHSHDGEKIKINSKFVNGDIRIEICNRGDPIPEEERALIWERYHRAQHQGGRKQGTGLGLSIVKTICDAHNMTYGTDYIDENNVFWFQIPKKRIVFSKNV